MQRQVFIISAPSGAGKSTIIKAILQALPDTRLSVSHTTRPARAHEKEGREYFFVPEKDFKRMIEEEAFLEHAQVFNHHYGTSRAQIEAAEKAGFDLLLDIDVQGAKQLRKKIKNAVHIFILPPSWEALEERLQNRHTDAPEAIARRLKHARTEVKDSAVYDYVIMNDTIEKAVEGLISIIRAERLKTAHALPGLKKKIQL